MTAERLAQLVRFAHYAAYHVPVVELVPGLKDAEAGDDMLELCAAIDALRAERDSAWAALGTASRLIERLMCDPPAPELLAMVRKLRHVIYALGIDPVDEDFCSILEQADLAIAKAEGR